MRSILPSLYVSLETRVYFACSCLPRKLRTTSPECELISTRILVAVNICFIQIQMKVCLSFVYGKLYRRHAGLVVGGIRHKFIGFVRCTCFNSLYDNVSQCVALSRFAFGGRVRLHFRLVITNRTKLFSLLLR